MREGSRSASMECGELSVVIAGLYMMLLLFVGSLDIQKSMVSELNPVYDAILYCCVLSLKVLVMHPLVLVVAPY